MVGVLALEGCRTCGGSGLHQARQELRPCWCVLRGAFRAVYNHYRGLVGGRPTQISETWFWHGKFPRQVGYGRRSEEFRADFELVSRRHLDTGEWRLFRLHFLWGWPWRVCCGRLGIDRGTFFHAVYRIEERLGRVFRELQPYALHPVEEYFAPLRRGR